MFRDAGMESEQQSPNSHPGRSDRKARDLDGCYIVIPCPYSLLIHSFIQVFIELLLCIRHLGHSSEPEKVSIPELLLYWRGQINKHVNTENKINKAELGDRDREKRYFR